jgi:hypothetical protein
MLKKFASFVLARHCRLTVSAAYTSLTRFIQRVVNLRGSTYRQRKEPASAGSGWAGKKGTPRPLASLRPRCSTFLTILQAF